MQSKIRTWVKYFNAIPTACNTNTPQVGLEPTTNRLTADCSTTELLRIEINLFHFILL